MAGLPDAGPGIAHFPLTLAPGERTEAAGPFFYSQHSEERWTWGIPPFFSHTEDKGTDSEESDFLYPLLSYDRYGEQYRWHFFQLFSFAGGASQVETNRDRFTIFPIYFQQRSSDPDENYTALFPIYGTLKHRLMRDEIFFSPFPLYVKTRKDDVITRNYVYPIFHLRQGDGLSGWQFWPLFGNETKSVTEFTNRFGETETVGGHEKRFVLWPIYHNQRLGLGTPNPELQQAIIPFYNILRSPKRDSTTILWPLFNIIDDREKKYLEKQLPWPVVVIARGEGKNVTRVWPFYARGESQTLSTRTYMWPFYRSSHLRSAPLDRRRIRIVYFLYSDTVDKNTDTGASRRRLEMFPFFSHKRELNGNTRLQVLSVLEPFLPASKSIERNWSPLWSFYRADSNPKTGAAHKSLLWNLWRRETSPGRAKNSLLFGLLQTEKDSSGTAWRVFYLPFGKSGASPQKADGK